MEVYLKSDGVIAGCQGCNGGVAGCPSKSVYWSLRPGLVPHILTVDSWRLSSRQSHLNQSVCTKSAGSAGGCGGGPWADHLGEGEEGGGERLAGQGRVRLHTDRGEAERRANLQWLSVRLGVNIK